MREVHAIVEPGSGYQGDQYRVLVLRGREYRLHALYATLESAQHERDRLNTKAAGR